METFARFVRYLNVLSAILVVFVGMYVLKASSCPDPEVIFLYREASGMLVFNILAVTATSLIRIVTDMFD